MTRSPVYRLALLLALYLFTASAPSAVSAKDTFVTIGTGGITGVYYPTGGAIARMVNKNRKAYGIRATVESTDGSVFNVNAVMVGDLEFGIVQSDRQYQAVKGLADWQAPGPQKKLRAVFSVHPESVTLVAALDTGIERMADLKGKKVNIGNPGSGQRQNAINALAASGLDFRKDIRAESVNAADAPRRLLDGRLDAFFYTVGHPNGAIKEATAGRRAVRFIPITNIEGLLATYPYYTPTTVPIDIYPGAANREPVSTFGVKATLVTSADVPDAIVYAITREVFENFREFKRLHPAYKTLTKRGMLEGLSAPIHPGAMRYYKEVGLR